MNNPKIRYDASDINISLLVMMTLKQRIRITQIAAEVGVNRQTVTHWRNGLNEPATRDTLDKLVLYASNYLSESAMEKCGVRDLELQE